jgi:hypothetical protein
MILQRPDSLRAVLDSVFADPAYRWVHRPAPLAGLALAWARLKDWYFRLSEANPLAYRIVLDLLLAATLAVVIHAAWTFLKGVRQSDTITSRDGASAVRHDEEWYRREADRLAAAGHFPEAVQADFLALVLALDARSALRFHPSKTPGEYARESRLAPAARDEFRDLVQRLYSFAFARSPCGPAEFADWRARATPERYAPAN